MGGVVTTFVVFSLVACAIWCPRGYDTTPPSITCPRISTPVYTPASSREAVITYENAIASDDAGIRRVEQITPSDYFSGDHFPIGSYRISFKATDNNGLTSVCESMLEVIARPCPYPEPIYDGSYSCDTPLGQSPVYGEECTFSCDIGYNLVGTVIQTCGLNEQWSDGGSVTCQIKTCQMPTVPDNAVIDTCTDSFNYNSVCVYTCSDGFEMAAGVERYVRCREDELWTALTAACVDSRRPVIENCPDHQTIYLGANVDYGVASWDIPTATDNYDSFISVEQEEGLPPGSHFTIHPTNVHTIIYGASDIAGNSAIQCTFNIIVQQITCPAIQHSYRLNISCPDTLVYGASCEFQCDTGYPLIGPSHAYCDVTSDDPPTGYWNWGQNMSAPFCETVDCPDLHVPINGALACDAWLHGIYCSMLCNSEYDISRTAPSNGEYVCADTDGRWLPTDEVPDCTRRRDPDSIRLPNELYYYTGNCTAEDTQNRIRENVIENLLSSSYSELCTLYEDCSVENVEITCGEVDDRKKRDISERENAEKFFVRNRRQADTHFILVRFDFVLYHIHDGELTAGEIDDNTYEQFDALIAFMEGYINEGGMNIAGLTYLEESYYTDESSIDCDLGTVAEYTTFTCRSCPTGTYYDTNSGDCIRCHVGTYQDTDGETSCTNCPHGFSTEEDGARSIHKCIAICPPGEYSQTGLVPCAKCPIDTYSENEMQIECVSCPEGFHTSNIGAVNILSCVTDIIPGGPCSTYPCSSEGICIRQGTEYQCQCANGYSGNTCEIPPDPCTTHACQHDSTCIGIGENADDYICQCSVLYTGHFCQHLIVNGGWGEWGNWSACSATCEEGQQERYRRCDNPKPNIHGDDCIGSNVTVQACNVRDCPSCTDLFRPYGSRLRCSQDDNVKTCAIECRPGFYYTTNALTEYTCGPDTNFVWSPEVSPNEMPTCSEATIPRRLTTTSHLEYDDAPSSSMRENEELQTAMLNIASENLPCLESNDCSVSVHYSNGGRKRSSTITFELVVEADIGEYEVMVDGVYNNETAVEGLTQLVLIVNQLEILAAVFNESAHNGSLALVIDGVSYYPDPNALTLSGDTGCSPGETTVTFVCVNCPPGSYGDGTECTLCALGEYQELERQSNCESCPEGYTTDVIGSSNSSDCIELDSGISSEEHESDNDTEDDESDNNDDSNENGQAKTGRTVSRTAVIAIAVSIVVAVILVVGVVVIVKKSKFDQVAPSRPNSASAWTKMHGSQMALHSGMNGLPPRYTETDLHQRDSRFDEKLVNAVRYNSLPPIATKAK